VLRGGEIGTQDRFAEVLSLAIPPFAKDAKDGAPSFCGRDSRNKRRVGHPPTRPF
jgi:hypothetical protein